jgi:hypothetical protein
VCSVSAVHVSLTQRFLQVETMVETADSLTHSLTLHSDSKSHIDRSVDSSLVGEFFSSDLTMRNPAVAVDQRIIVRHRGHAWVVSDESLKLQRAEIIWRRGVHANKLPPVRGGWRAQ